MEIVDGAETKPLLDEVEKGQTATQKSHFEYVIAIRLPSAVKKKEQEAFTKYLEKVHPNKSAKEVIESFIVSKKCLEKSSLSCGEGATDDLKGALNCTINMLLSFFDTLAKSLGEEIEVFKFNSIEVNKIFLCTRMSTGLAEKLADMAEYPVQLSEQGIEKLGIKISDENKKGLVPAYMKYDKNQQDKGLVQKRGASILTHVDRIRLLYDKLTDYIEIWELMRLYQSQNITFKMYPVHEEAKIERLRETWASVRFFWALEQPIDEIREYFGEQIAFYFLFDNFVRKSLAILLLMVVPLYPWFGEHPWIDTMLGTPLEDGQHHTYTAWVDTAYSVMTITWITLTVKFWRRTETYYANLWGMDYAFSLAKSVKKRVNPDFHGEAKPLMIDENIKKMAPDMAKRRKGLLTSAFVTAGIIAFGVICVMLNRFYVGHNDPEFHVDLRFMKPYAATLLAVQIKIFDLLWAKIGPRLAANEEHTELVALDQSAARKYSIFLTFNTFQGFVWIAYVQPVYAMGGHGPEHYRALLTHSLETAFPILIVFAFLAMLLPWHNIKQKYAKQVKDLQKKEDLEFFPISSYEEQTKKLEYLGEDAMYDFTATLSSVAFVGLFGVVSPLSTVALAYFAVTVQHRVDAMRLCTLYQRTYPDRAANIGVYSAMLTALKYISIVNVCGLLSTNPHVDLAVLFGILPQSMANEVHAAERLASNSTTQFESDTQQDRVVEEAVLLWIANKFAFLSLLAGLCFVAWAVDKAIPNEDAQTTREKKRQNHQRSKLFGFENSEFSEKIDMEGTGDFAKSKYEEVSKLRPEDPLYIKPIQIC